MKYIHIFSSHTCIASCQYLFYAFYWYAFISFLLLLSAYFLEIGKCVLLTMNGCVVQFYAFNQLSL